MLAEGRGTVQTIAVLTFTKKAAGELKLRLRAGRDPGGKGLCGMRQGERTQRETRLKPGELKYFRLSIDANGKPDIQRSDQISEQSQA